LGLVWISGFWVRSGCHGFAVVSAPSGKIEVPLVCTYSRLRNNASGLIGVLPGPVFRPNFWPIASGFGPEMGPRRAPPSAVPFLDPFRCRKICMKTGPGRTPIKPEALLRNREYTHFNSLFHICSSCRSPTDVPSMLSAAAIEASEAFTAGVLDECGSPTEPPSPDVIPELPPDIVFEVGGEEPALRASLLHTSAVAAPRPVPKSALQGQKKAPGAALQAPEVENRTRDPPAGGGGGGKSKGKTMGDCHRPTTSSKATSGQPKKTPDCLQVPSWVPESGLDLNPAPWPFNRVQGS